MRALVIEDDPQISQFIQHGLLGDGFEVESADNGRDGLELASQKNHDIIIADIMLPHMSGIAIIEELRKQKNHTPVIIVSAKETVDDRVIALQKGSDDYITKPFALSELIARTRALLRRSNFAAESTSLEVGDLKLDLITRTVHRGDKDIDLQPREFALLELLLRHQRTIISKRHITENIWKFNFDPGTNVVDVLVCRLRNKVDRDFDIKLIHTVRGLGYVLQPDTSHQ